jgi:hypothetical protein
MEEEQGLPSNSRQYRYGVIWYRSYQVDRETSIKACPPLLAYDLARSAYNPAARVLLDHPVGKHVCQRPPLGL